MPVTSADIIRAQRAAEKAERIVDAAAPPVTVPELRREATPGRLSLREMTKPRS